MCLLCANPNTVLDNVLGNYRLVVATEDAFDIDDFGNRVEWNKGEYALIHKMDNQPHFIWNDIKKDPFLEMKDEDIDLISPHDSIWNEWQIYVQWIRNHIAERFTVSPEYGYLFYKACIANGYDKTNDGDLLSWTMVHIYRLTQNHIGITLVVNDTPTLNLNGLGLNQIPIHLISNPEKVIELDLSNNDIRVLSSELSQFINLRTINLSNNPLVSLPKEIGELEKLECLIVRNGQLRHLPQEITRLKNLKALDVSNNQLTILPNSIIGELLNLKSIKIDDNPIRELPYMITGLVFLTHISADRTNLEFDTDVPSQATISAQETPYQAVQFLKTSFEDRVSCLNQHPLGSEWKVTYSDNKHIKYRIHGTATTSYNNTFTATVEILEDDTNDLSTFGNDLDDLWNMGDSHSVSIQQLK